MIRKHKPVKGGVLPSKYGAFDCETEGLYGRAQLICLVLNNGDRQTFQGNNCVADFIDEITRSKYRGYKLYAHNLSFDLEKTFGAAFGNSLDNKDFVLTLAGARLIRAVYHFGGNKCLTLEDTLNLIPSTTLGDIGAAMGYEKFKTPDKWLSGEPVTEIDSEDVEYCFRDCDIVMKILDVYEELIRPFGIKIKVTVGSNAKAVWKSIYLKDKPQFVDEIKDERFRESYYGGRTETFIRKHIKKSLFHYDVNSMYPAVMLDNLFPDPDKLKYSSDIHKALREHEGCAKLTVVAPNNLKYPVLPYRTNKLIFPIGEFTGTWNFPEIRLALDKGYKIIKTDWVLSSKPIQSPFNEYVKYFMDKKIFYKLAKKPALVTLVKYMLNSLYGKFAQRNDISDRYTHEKPEVGVPYKKIGDNTYKLRSVDKERSNETVVCWSSYITSYSRVLLYTYIPNSGLYYCDTDSVFRDTPIVPELVSRTEFGLMDLEDTVTESYFVAPKRYCFINTEGNTIKRLKGVSSEIVKNLPIESFGSDIGIFYNKPTKMKTALIRGVDVYSKEVVRKNLRIVDDKRIFSIDGNSVPIKIVV